MKFFPAKHCSQHYHSMPTHYTLHITYFKKSAQQHSGHNSKPQESSATANEIRHWNVHFSEADEGSDHFWKSATLY